MKAAPVLLALAAALWMLAMTVAIKQGDCVDRGGSYRWTEGTCVIDEHGP